MEWKLTREGNFDTYVLELSDATLKVFTALPNGSFENSMGLVVLNQGGILPVFDKQNKNAYGTLEQMKQMTLKTYKNKDVALAAKRVDQIYGSLIVH